MNDIIVRKAEIKASRHAAELGIIKDLGVAILTNPVASYIGGMVTIEYLVNHYSNYQDQYGVWWSRPYLERALGVGMEGALTAAMIANSLGGLTGIGNLLKALP